MQNKQKITIECTSGKYIPINKGMYYVSNHLYEDANQMHNTIRILTSYIELLPDIEYFNDNHSLHGIYNIMFDQKQCHQQIEKKYGYIYTLTILKSDIKRKVVISYANWGFYNIWLNNNLLTSLPYSKNNDDATILYLEPGDNYLITRLDIRRSTIGISLRVNMYDYEYAISSKNEYITYLVRKLERKQIKLIFDYSDDIVTHFMLLKTDLTNQDTYEYSYRMIRTYGNECIYFNTLPLYEWQVFPPACNIDQQSQLYDFIIYSDGVPIYKNIILLSTMKTELSYLEQVLQDNSLRNIKKKYIYDIQEKTNILYSCVPLYLNYCFYSAYLYLYELRSIYHLLQYGKDFSYYCLPSLHHFASELDGHDEQIGIHIPYGFDPTNTSTKYSLCILATTGPDHMVIFDRFPELLYYYSHLPIIFASITGKGVTTGSYTGEAAFMDCFSELHKLFPIDDRKVFLHGTSNGAYATWSLAESYPHLFAAISPISGCPKINELNNLCNIYIYNVHENPEHGLDLYSSFDYPNYFFIKEGIKHDSIQYEHESHVDLYKLLFHPSIINHLIHHQSETYPKHIHYLTSNGAHNQAYYIKIQGVVPSAMEASFDSTIVIEGGKALWNIITNDITGLYLETPPYLRNMRTKLILNSYVIKDEILPLSITLNCISDNNSFDAIEEPFVLWNTGVIGCYQSTVKILIPDTNSYDYDSIKQVALCLSSPKTNGYIHQTRVHYPIYSEREITCEMLSSSNWIVIGSNYTNPHIQKMIQTKCFSWLDNGFMYNRNEYNDQYSMLYALPNIYNHNFCVTVITYSSPNIMKSNLFLRNLLLPSASSGFHPYLNQAVLVKIKSKYYCAKSLGNELITVDQFISSMNKKESLSTVTWDMADYNDAISLIAINIENKDISESLFKADGWAGDPNLTIIDKEIDADHLKYLVIEYMNGSGGRIAQLFFSHTSRYDFCEDESILFNVIPNDTIIRRYLIDLSDIKLWSGTICAVRFDPFSYDVIEGHFEISKIEFSSQKPIGNYVQIISLDEAKSTYEEAGFFI